MDFMEGYEIDKGEIAGYIFIAVVLILLGAGIYLGSVN